jgi:3-deoxy-D-arabino-heptulosonate 7-phosphate (DAHP) synthase class II
MPNNESNKHKTWVKKDLDWLKNNHVKARYKDIAKKFGRTERAIKAIVIIKGWAKHKPKWKKEETLFLKKYHNVLTTRELSRELRRSKNSVLSKIHRLNLKQPTRHI